MKKIFVTTLLWCLFVGVSPLKVDASDQSGDHSVNYIVEGSVDGLDGKVLYMFDYDKKVNIDSVTVTDGRFQFNGTYERPAYVRIENGRFFSNCILDSLAVVDFESHGPSSGSDLNMRLIELFAENKKIEDELVKFYNELKSHGFEQPELGEIYSRLYAKLQPKHIQQITQMISDNPNGVGEAAIMKLGGQRGLTPDQWDNAYSKMTPYLKDRKWTVYFNNLYNHLRNSQPGKPFIDFPAKTTDGTDVMLSDYVGKGKYVIIDFWASWCGPCKEEAEKTLRPLYEKYKDDERFMILGVATWDKHDKTLAALEKLQYPWTQIIDAGETPMKLYGFDGIPQIFFIGPDGIILNRDIRGERIIHTVDSVLNKKE